MSEIADVLEDLADDTVLKRGDHWLMARAAHERWEIPEALRGPLIKRLGEIVTDPTAGHREVLGAVTALLAASKINLANIATSISAERHEILEQRMTEIERKMDTGQVGAVPSGGN